MAWYKDGTVAVTQGLPSIVGTGTLWASTVMVGDIFTVNNEDSYEVAEIADNTHITLGRAYTGVTAVAQPYAMIPVSRSWGMNEKLAERLSTLMETFHQKIDDGEGIKGDDGKPGWTMRGDWSAGISYVQGDLASYNDNVWMCVIDNTDVMPVAGSAYWANITTTVTVKRSGRPA